jgi:hypothetical protein
MIASRVDHLHYICTTVAGVNTRSGPPAVSVPGFCRLSTIAKQSCILQTDKLVTLRSFFPFSHLQPISYYSTLYPPVTPLCIICMYHSILLFHIYNLLISKQQTCCSQCQFRLKCLFMSSKYLFFLLLLLLSYRFVC